MEKKIRRTKGTAKVVANTKKMVEALKETEEIYRLAVENAVESITIVQDGALKFANTKTSEIYGYSLEELTSINPAKVYHPEDYDRIMDYYARRLKGEDVPKTYEFRIINKSGEVRWLERRVTVISWAGRPAVLVFDADVTGRKQKEVAIKESEEKYHSLVENISDIIFSIDSQGYFTYISPAVVKVTGYKPEEVIGQKFSQFLFPEDVPQLLNRFQHALTGKLEAIEAFECRTVSKEGKAVWLRIFSSPYMKEGQVVGLAGTMIDITERKKAEEALQKTEARYRSIVDNAIEGIAQVTPEGRFIMANQALADMLGYDSPEELMATVTDAERQLYVEPERRTEFRQLMEKFDKVEGFEAQIYRKDGGVIWVSLNERAVRDEKGAVLYYEGMVENITRRKQAEEELKQSRDKLKKSRGRGYPGFSFNHRAKGPLHCWAPTACS